MYVRQISVFLENARGALAKLTRLFADNGLDMIALSIAETEHYGIVRCIVSDTERCLNALRDAGYTARLTEVLAVCVPDRPGGLCEVLELFSRNNISVEYLYSFVRSSGTYALIIFHLDDLEKGTGLLLEHGIKMITQAEIEDL